jgi:sugar lactone lactonase YvrE
VTSTVTTQQTPKRAQRLVLVAGGGEGNDGSPAIQAKLFEPVGVGFDGDGNLFIAEMSGQRLLRVDTRGILTTFGGTGTAGYSGDGGPATKAQFNNLHNLAVASNGAIYLSDTWNCCVRKVNPDSGVVTTIAGNGQKGSGGEGVLATEVSLGGIYCVALDTQEEHLYLADLDNRRVRALNLQTGVLTTVAGNGECGVPTDGMEARTSPLVDPRAVALDADDNLYILERNGHALRVVGTDNCIRTVVGTGIVGASGDGGEARQATLNAPKDLCIDLEGNVILADTNNHLIRKYLSHEDKVVRITGTGRQGSTGLDGDPLNAALYYPHGVYVHPSGTLYIADSFNHRVLKIV